MGDTVGHADSRVPGAAKAGMLNPGKLAPPPSLPSVHPAAMRSFTGKSIAMCPHKTHPRKETSKPLYSRDSRRGRTVSTRPGARTHTAEVSTLPLPQPQEKPRFPAKVPSWGRGTPSHAEGVAWQQGKIYHHYPNIISRLDSGSS